MHSITNKQKDILNSFSCDRLSNCSDRTIVLNQFESEKGKMLVKYLKDKGHIEDSSGESAFYLIQNKEKLPLLFFSLKCGSLFSPFDIEEFENRAKITNKMLDVLKAQRDESDPFQNMVYNQLKDIAIKSNIEVDEYILDLIIAEVPMKIVKKGAKLPSSGEGYRVLSEDEYNKEQEQKTDSRWAALDDIEL